MYEIHFEQKAVKTYRELQILNTLKRLKFKCK